MPRKSAYIVKIKPNLENIIIWKSQNLKESEIIRKLDINPTTWYKYRNSKKELRDAIETGTNMLTRDIESVLFKKAMGFTRKETKKIIDRKGEQNFIKKYEETDRYYPPHFQSIMTILNKNLPNEYKTIEEETVDVEIETLANSFKDIVKKLDEEE